MRLLSVAALCVALLSTAFAEDAKLRARAFELAEHAREVSTVKQAGVIPNETVLTFRAMGADGTMREGSYTRVFAGPTGTREEFTSSTYHLVRIALPPNRIAFIGGSRTLPPEFREALSLIPIQLWHFDQEDVIREIRQITHKGVAAQCVEFDTTRGTETFNNEMCLDAKTGSEIYDRSGDMEIENSGFFDFGGALLPSHVTQYRKGVVWIDVQLTRKVIAEPVSADMFTPPSTAAISTRCETYRRAFGESMPQPAGNGGAVTNVIVHAVIGTDGKVTNAAIESSDRPDLNDEALKIARTWTFTPAMCNGKPNVVEVNLVVRFQGR